MVEHFPRELNTLVLSDNQLYNQDVRALSLIRILTKLDIRDNAKLTLGATKTFPLFYLKSLRQVEIWPAVNKMPMKGVPGGGKG